MASITIRKLDESLKRKLRVRAAHRNHSMEDEARDRGIVVDKEALGRLLGIAVIGTVAPEKRGIRELKAAIQQRGKKPPGLSVDYGPVLEDYVRRVSAYLPETPISGRSLALMMLAGDESLGPWLKANLAEEAIDSIEALRDECALKLGRPVSLYINEMRLKRAEEIVEKVMSRTEGSRNRFFSWLGRASMHPVTGLPLLLLVLFGIYEFVGVFGAGTLVDIVEKVIFGRYLNPMFTKVVHLLVPGTFFQEMLVGEYGAITMALTYAVGIILPITTTFFIAFALLEDSGYLPRLAIMSNKVFNVMGLSGKAVLPMVLGLGCGTMAVMTTRILEGKRDRLIATFLLALAIPCSAQLGVILGMVSALSWKAMAIWVGTVLFTLLLGGGSPPGCCRAPGASSFWRYRP
jgi:ferrous iron transport protein B